MTSISDLMYGQHTPITSTIADEWRNAGFWENRTLRSLLDEAAAETPDRIALVGRRSDGGRVTRSYAEFDAGAHHAASALASLGVQSGDGVVVMLPNWVEYAEIVFGILEIGGVYAGIPVAYGARQAAAILRRSKAKVLVIPRRWRSNDHLELSRELRKELPHLETVIVVDGEPEELWEGEVLWSSLDSVEEHSFDAPDPGQLCYLGFTSGTTGEPKGAMHSHESLIYSARHQAQHVGEENFGTPMVQLVASPVGHHTGFVWGLVLTVLVKGTGVHVDRWDPEWGVEVIKEEGVTTFFGAPTFLQDMVRTSLAGDPDCPFKLLIIAGAPVPRGLPKSAGEALGAYIAPAWGMTECSIIFSCTPLANDDIQRTDGSVFDGSEVKIVDLDDEEVPVGKVGELLVRGPGVAFGYYDRPDATDESYLPGLWFRTGDQASADENGWLTLRGRTKDIIIRGGENIPVTEIESMIFDHPNIANTAVIGAPDERLGERICAVVVLKDAAQEITRESLSEFLLQQGLSKHYLPERVEVASELPTTPSGKIQKYKLKDLL